LQRVDSAIMRLLWGKTIKCDFDFDYMVDYRPRVDFRLYRDILAALGFRDNAAAVAVKQCSVNCAWATAA
jgi:hypothetical protein